jgi:hypothetical protein
MHISFKIIKFYFTLYCSTCFGHHCVHHQELFIAAHAVSGHRVVLGRLFPPALARHVSDTIVSIIRSFLLLHMQSLFTVWC